MAGGAALGEKLLRVTVALPGMAVGGIALIAIGSRGPIIATALGLLAWILMRGVLRARALLVVLAVTGVALIGVNQASSAALSRFVLEDPARRGLWATARVTFLEHPLLGLGFGDFSIVSAFTRIAQYPHNLFLETASELGVLGLLSLGTLLVVACTRVWRVRSEPEARMVAALAVAMLVGQLFSSDLTNRLFWIAVDPLSPVSDPRVLRCPFTAKMKALRSRPEAQSLDAYARQAVEPPPTGTQANRGHRQQLSRPPRSQ